MEFLSKLMSPAQVEARIIKCLTKQKPCSLIRINDGETRVIAYQVLSLDRWKLPARLRVTGVAQHTEPVRQALIQAIKEADIVGLTTGDRYINRPLAEAILDHFQLNPKRICAGSINMKLYRNGGLKRLIQDRKILLIGCTIGRVIPQFRKMGAQIAGVESIERFEEIPAVLERVKRYSDYDLALVSAGIPAKILCTQISCRYRKVALDLGHVPEKILYPEKSYSEVITQWLAEHPAKP